MAAKPTFSKTSHGATSHAVDFDPPEDSPGLGATSSQMKTALSGFLAARVELASIEAKEAAQFTAKKVVLGVILGISAFFIWALVLAGLTGVLAPIFEGWLTGKVNGLPGWAAALFALAIIHGIIALIALIGLKKKPASPLFELSRQEIENDKQWLQKNK